MKQFLFKCLLFFAVFFILEKSLILLRNSASEREVDKRLELILNGKINADIVVIGSSRGARDIVAAQIADSLQTTAYNLSYPGSNVQFHEYLLTKLIQFKNKKPKLVVLAVDDQAELKVNSTINFRFERLYPLVKYEDVRKTLIAKGDKNKILSELFIVHQLGLSSFDLRRKHFDELDTIQADGSMPIAHQSLKFKSTFTNHYNTYDSTSENEEKITSFKNFIQLCKENNIRLLFALAPNFGNPTIGFKNRMDQFTRNENTSLMIYDTLNPIYKNPAYYFDPGHLQKNGATVFTAELISYIKEKDLLK